MTDQARLGIVGFGSQGGMYATLLSAGRVPGMSLGAIADIDAAARRRAEQAHPGIPIHTDLNTMLASGYIDAVVIAVPHFLHPEMGIAALASGVHVLVEKPIGVYTKQAQRLVDFAATKPELSFAVMFNQRTNPLFRRIKEIIDNGEIGTIRRTTWTITTWWRPQGYYDSSSWRATWGGEGGGVLVNQAPHQLDLWQWLCGKPVSVDARLGYGVHRDIVVENEVTALVNFSQGAFGVFVTCTYDVAGTDRLEILGDAGKIVVEDSKKATIIRLPEPEQELSSRMGSAEVARIFSGEVDTASLYTTETIEHTSAWGQQHADVLANFAANILHGTPLVAPGGDALDSVRLANAIHLSEWKGQAVPLEHDPDEYLRLLNERIRTEGRFPERTH